MNRVVLNVLPREFEDLRANSASFWLGKEPTPETEYQWVKFVEERFGRLPVPLPCQVDVLVRWERQGEMAFWPICESRYSASSTAALGDSKDG